MMDLDKKDYQILECLIENSRISYRQMAQKTKIPVMTVMNRIKRLEKMKIIKYYTAKLDHEKLGFKIVAYMLINTDYNHLQDQERGPSDIAKELTRYPFVSCISSLAGKNDILLRVRARDIKELNKFVTKIGHMRGIDNTETLVVLNDVGRNANTHRELITLLRDKVYAGNLLA